MKLEKGIYFISGIDTDIGKTVCTGMLAQQQMALGQTVITQKLIQTGGQGFSEDIEKHRELMGLQQGERFLEDLQGLTAPAIYAYPASPHLASKLENKVIDLDRIDAASRILAQRYEVVLIEGAGGLMVPLSEEVLCIDYLATRGYPCILVTSGRLGSINHTLLSLHALQQYKVPVYSLLFNAHDDSQDPLIAVETRQFLQRYLQKHFPTAQFFEVASLNS
ncbi:MAG: dethiobiotin synthase [Alcaligenaceae bacterium]|nr:dethiobiotin synthase [Alcaligenaceae bacterium]